MLNGDRKHSLDHRISDRVVERIEDLGRISLMLQSILEEMSNYHCDSKESFREVFGCADNLDELYELFNDLHESLFDVQQIADGDY